MRLLLLIAATRLCTSFAPSTPSTCPYASRTSPSEQQNHCTLHATQMNEVVERVGKATGTAFCALALSFSAIGTPSMLPFSDTALSAVPSASASVLSSKTSSSRTNEDAVALRTLEIETREVEKEVKADLKRARIEKSKEAFFEYDAKMAQETEARIEAKEKAAELEFENDKEQVNTLAIMELKAERELQLASTKEEKAAKQKEVKLLLAEEKTAERKEKRAQKAEKIFLAEEQQEQKILQQKLDAERREEKEFDRVEKEYESEVELAKEDELELELAKTLVEKK